MRQRQSPSRRAAALGSLILVLGLVLSSGPAASAAPGDADLVLTQADTPDPANVGDTVTYSVSVLNTGPDPAVDPVVTDTIPAGSTFVSATSADGSCGAPDGGGTLSCDLDDLADGESAAVQVQVTTTSAGAAVNRADAESSSPDPVPADNTDIDETTTVAEDAADLVLTQDDSPDPANVLQEVTYEVVVTNEGPGRADDVVVTDTFPAGAQFVSATTADGACSPPVGDVLTCDLNPIEAQASAQVDVVIFFTTLGQKANQASVTASTPDPDPSDNAEIETTFVQGGLSCTITGTSGDDLLPGTTGNDVICGLGGNDELVGLAGNDRLDGGQGNDTLRGGDGNDEALGRLGDDDLDGGQGAADLARFDASDNPVTVDLVAGTAIGEGSDTLAGFEGAVGSRGDDTLLGSPENDSLYGRRGADVVNGRKGTDFARYDLANGPVQASLQTGTTTGADGEDTLVAVENLIGSGHADTLQGDAENNQIFGRGDDDSIKGGSGFDFASYDFATTGVSVDLIAGSASGEDGDDSLVGFEGITGSQGSDVLTGSPGPNTIAGRAGADEIRTRAGPDSLFGEIGNDDLFGERNDDALFGGDGNDDLDGGKGTDSCAQQGGTGARMRCESQGQAAPVVVSAGTAVGWAVPTSPR